MKRFLALLLVAAFSTFATAQTAKKKGITFEKDVRPIFRKHCFDCHGAEAKLRGGLDLRLRRFMVKGGESGAAIVPGKANDSLLIERIRKGEMPPGDAKVSKAELAILVKWVKAGAPTARPEPKKIPKGLGITEEERSYWAFQPIKRPTVPSFTSRDRVRTPIDAILQARMKPSGLKFSPDADRMTLIRRVYFDLIGLPPSRKDVQQFLKDKSPDAYEKLVDRVLKSKHYGERWGRHWLDTAGYADSEGYSNSDNSRPYAYKYRDYVIRSFNSDKPFNQFIIEQLAGDEMVKRPVKNLTPRQIELLVATGFLRMATDGTQGNGGPVATNHVITDTIKIVSTSLLGLSIGCCQCHDHRYDPIPQTDYYRFRALFEPALNWKKWRNPSQRRVSLYTDADRAKSAAIEREVGKVNKEHNEKQTKFIEAALKVELKKFPKALADKLYKAYHTSGSKRTAEQKRLLKQNPSVNISGGNLYQYNQGNANKLKAIQARMKKMRAEKPKEDFLRVLLEVDSKLPKTFVFYRGDYRQPLKQEIPPGGLTVTAPEGSRFDAPKTAKSKDTSGRRLAYAKFLTNGKHPLVARVLVNRFWMHHFGRAIVGTPGEFGRLGETPSHPKLLDFLADEFMKQGWSLKKFHRLIMNSTVYRQSSIQNGGQEKIDPANLLYWRKPIQRLDAEIVRDRILATSGLLKPDKMFGQPATVKADDRGQVTVADNSRRSIYVEVKRTKPVAFLRTFDAPVMEVNCDRRESSTVAPQALMLMNSDFVLKQADVLAKRAIKEAPMKWKWDPKLLAGVPKIKTDDPKKKPFLHHVAQAWLLAYQRPPTNKELKFVAEFANMQIDAVKKSQPKRKPRLQVLTNLAQALLSSNEFLYID